MPGNLIEVTGKMKIKWKCVVQFEHKIPLDRVVRLIIGLLIIAVL